jgi:hypothetical protein
MNDMPVPTKPDSSSSPVEVRSREPAPSWRELRDRFTDLMKDIGSELREVWEEEGKGLRREATTRLLPALRRSKDELEKLIARLEQRQAEQRQAEESAQPAAKQP